MAGIDVRIWQIYVINQYDIFLIGVVLDIWITRCFSQSFRQKGICFFRSNGIIKSHLVFWILNL